jgi:hypothetical protein
MIFDAQNLFSDAQSLANATATLASTNVIDRGPQGTPQHATARFKADLGKGVKIPLRAQIVTTVTGGTSIALAVQVSVDEAFTSPITVVQTPAIAVASLVAGYVFPIDLIPLKTNERFVRLVYIKVGTQTAGAVTAGITLGNDEQWD